MNDVTPPKRYYRSRSNRILAGVCGGLAEYFNTDPTLVRVAFVVLAMAFGVTVFIYLLLWLIAPEAPV